jgi:hypothetical protein
MHMGLMWFDDDPRKTIEVKMEQAAARYHEKYGSAPTACYVSMGAAAAGGKHGAMRIVPSRAVRANYLWVGMDEG